MRTNLDRLALLIERLLDAELLPTAEGARLCIEIETARQADPIDHLSRSDPDGDPLTCQWSEGSTVLGNTASLNVSLALGIHTLTLTVTDTHGVSSSDDVVITIQDTTAPMLTFGTPTPAANAAGWNNTPVDLLFTTADSGSGAASVSTSNPLHFTSEGANQTQAVTVTDNAGNSKTFTAPAVNIDLTAPTTAASSSGTAISTVTLSASDSLSGVKGTYYRVDGGRQQTYSGPFTLAQGNYSVQYWSVDQADNQETVKWLDIDTRYAVTVTVANVSGKRGGKVTLSATVTQTSNKAKLSGKAVTFLVDGVFAGNAITNKQGVASVSFTIPTSFAIGSHSITAIAQQDGTYRPGTGAGTLSVNR